MRHHFRDDPDRSFEPLGDVPRGGEDFPRLAERDSVEALDRAARCALLRALAELAELRSVELVRLAELVKKPDDLVRMTDRVRRELGRDDELDRAPVGLGEVEQPPEERLREDALARIPLVRDGHEI